jgi:sulfur carrier protein ThiS
MKVTVRFLGELRYLIPANRETGEMEVPEGTSISQILETLKVPPHMVALQLRNKASVRKTEIVKEGDIIELVPVSSGG